MVLVEDDLSLTGREAAVLVETGAEYTVQYDV